MAEKFFIFAPGYSGGLTWFETLPDWHSAVQSFDFSAVYCGDGVWEAEVENCFAGRCPAHLVFDDDDLFDTLRPYAAYVSRQINRRERPDDLDEDGFSPSTGDHWEEDWNYICDYCFAPTALQALQPEENQPSTHQEER